MTIDGVFWTSTFLGFGLLVMAMVFITASLTTLAIASTVLAGLCVLTCISLCIYSSIKH